jgi:hypothetical protein
MDDRLNRIREADMRSILRHALPRRCFCGGLMLALRIQHGFKQYTATSTGYRLYYTCQKCGTTCMFMSALYLAQVAFGGILAGGGLLWIMSSLPDDWTQHGAKTTLTIIGIQVFTTSGFLILSYALVVDLRNRLKFRVVQNPQGP